MLYLQIQFYHENTFSLKVEKNEAKFQMVSFDKTKFRFRVYDHKIIYQRKKNFSKESIQYLFHLDYFPSIYLGKSDKRGLSLTG